MIMKQEHVLLCKRCNMPISFHLIIDNLSFIKTSSSSLRIGNRVLASKFTLFNMTNKKASSPLHVQPIKIDLKMVTFFNLDLERF